MLINIHGPYIIIVNLCHLLYGSLLLSKLWARYHSIFLLPGAPNNMHHEALEKSDCAMANITGYELEICNTILFLNLCLDNGSHSI